MAGGFASPFNKELNLETDKLGTEAASVTWLSISAITIPPPHTSGDLQQKFTPTLGLLHPNFCPGEGWGFVGVGPEGRAFVHKRFLPFLNFYHNRKNWEHTTLRGLFAALNFFKF